MATELKDRGFVCTQCGGEGDLESGQRFLTCRFCDATLFIDRSGVVSHYRLPRLLGADEAEAALRRWMAGNDTVKDLDSKSGIEAVEAISFPVWLFRVQAAGGEEVFIEPAAPTTIPQLADFKLPAGKLEPYQAEEEVVEATPETIPLETARGWLEQRGLGRATETALVQLPLWRCRYSFENQSYLALVDASTGAVMAAVFPEKAESPYFLVAALGILLFTIEGLAISNPAAKFVAYLITAIPLLLLAYWVARKI
ncbi:MAG: hypothetical protein WBP10_03610 [Thermoanaerobaculia bacterium]|jgi:hypothetical protein